MHYVVTISLTVLTAIAGLIAALYWRSASKVLPLHPYQDIELADGTPGNTLYAPGEDWVSPLREAFADAGRLNTIAALWTAISVGLGVASGLSGIGN